MFLLFKKPIKVFTSSNFIAITQHKYLFPFKFKIDKLNLIVVENALMEMELGFLPVLIKALFVKHINK